MNLGLRRTSCKNSQLRSQSPKHVWLGVVPLTQLHSQRLKTAIICLSYSRNASLNRPFQTSSTVLMAKISARQPLYWAPEISFRILWVRCRL